MSEVKDRCLRSEGGYRTSDISEDGGMEGWRDRGRVELIRVYDCFDSLFYLPQCGRRN
jgi:hypothetical protein